ncbi:hypothetical protein [Bradyrhizobium sp. 17]|uniref:hypothetical protein n=1 Tax=Bradyrhizobium sp. 17 TaxID=2782649 RepID=UPI001FF85F8C|nr:hypothetical protein [Bradyrhizobium sp. 17]MCK1521589.1 hypothetical protein [Bradyrhizobium sp. 17]
METIATSTALVLAMLVALAFYLRLKITGLQRRLVSLERVEAKLDLLLKHAGVSYDPLGPKRENARSVPPLEQKWKGPPEVAYRGCSAAFCSCISLINALMRSIVSWSVTPRAIRS